MLVPLSVIARTLLLDRVEERLHRSLGGDKIVHPVRHHHFGPAKIVIYLAR
jgi:hypothetical protein